MVTGLQSPDAVARTGGGLNPRLARVRHALACPRCGGGLEFASQAAECLICAAAYPIRGGRLYCSEPVTANDSLDGFKSRLKLALGQWYYRLGVDLVAPTYPLNFARVVRRHLDPASGVVVDLGSGGRRIDEHIVTLDCSDYPEVDIVCDAEALPFKPASVDAFVSRSVLEHLPDAAGTVAMMARCTRPGGLAIHMAPLLYPYHASPGDYCRWTAPGLRELLGGWPVVEQFNATGPVTLALVCTIELLSTLLSLGRPRARALLHLALCGLLWPLKFLDRPFVRRRSMLALAPTICIVARKPEEHP